MNGHGARPEVQPLSVRPIKAFLKASAASSTAGHPNANISTVSATTSDALG